MSALSAYLLGVITLPLLAATGWAILHATHAAASAWTTWRPTFLEDRDARADHAAALAVARRVRVIRLPFGRVYAYRSTMPHQDDRRPDQAWGHVRNALDAAAADATVTGGA